METMRSEVGDGGGVVVVVVEVVIDDDVRDHCWRLPTFVEWYCGSRQNRCGSLNN